MKKITNVQMAWLAGGGPPSQFSDLADDDLSEVITALADELCFLRWFYRHADFGPAHEDVMDLYRQDYQKKVRRLPIGYGEDQ